MTPLSIENFQFYRLLTFKYLILAQYMRYWQFTVHAHGKLL